MGYRLEEINLHASSEEQFPEEVERASRHLKTEGIYGIILPLMVHSHYSQAEWANCVVSLIGGGHLRSPVESQSLESRFYPQRFPVADRDLFFNTRLAFQSLQDLGYKRIGMVYSRYIDAEANGQAQAGLFIEQGLIAPENRVPILFLERFKEGRPTSFDEWMDQNKPDAILCLNPVVRDWVEELGHHVPRDIGLANLNIVADVKDWAGIDEKHDEIGAAAVDLVIGALSRNELGLPPQPRKVLIPGEWTHGSTLRPLEKPVESSVVERR